MAATARRECHSLSLIPYGKQINGNTNIDQLLSDIENGGADEVLARTGYAPVAELAAA